MAKLTQTGTTTPIPSVVPDFLGQHYIDESTSPNTAYVATGTTSQDWQEIGAGSGGGGFGVVPASFIELNSVTTSHNWVMDTDGPLVVRADGAASLTLTLDISAASLVSPNIINNKLVIMAGDDDLAGNISLSINVGSNLFNFYNLSYQDTHNADNLYTSSGKTLTLNNQLLVFDITVFHEAADQSAGFPEGLIVCSKLSQAPMTVDNNAGGGG